MWIKNKKYTQKKKIILSAIFGIYALIIIVSASSKDTTVATDTQDNQSQISEQEEKIENNPIENFKTPFEKNVWTIVNNNSGILHSIHYDTYDPDIPNQFLAINLSCTRDETVIFLILDEISKAVVDNNIDKKTEVNIKDSDNKDSPQNIIIADIQTDGTLEIVYSDFRRVWVKEQFSSWDNSHTDLNELIMDNLNNEKSYEHIETSFINAHDLDNKDKANKLLSDSGYLQRVEIGDLLIITQFSAKNNFNATIKSIAIGISSYSNQTITLVAIE